MNVKGAVASWPPPSNASQAQQAQQAHKASVAAVRAKAGLSESCPSASPSCAQHSTGYRASAAAVAAAQYHKAGIGDCLVFVLAFVWTVSSVLTTFTR